MELLNFLKQIPFPVLLVAVLILLVVTLVIAFQYAKHKGLEGIREQVYQLILKAEHMYKESGAGQQKLKWVVQQARGLLPKAANGHTPRLRESELAGFGPDIWLKR